MTYPDEAAAILIGEYEKYSHSQIGTYLMKVGLSQVDPGKETPDGRGINREARLTTAFRKAPAELREKALKKLTVLLCTDRASEEIPDWVDELVAELREVGLSLHHDMTEIQKDVWSDPTPFYTWRIGPLGSEEIPLTAHSGQLEGLLRKNNLDVAAEHYSQAFDNFKTGNFEASNGQLRTALEEALLELADRSTSWTRTTQGGDAIAALAGKRMFADGEHDYFKGLWKLSHKDGPHPGLTTATEAEFRFHAITASIYFLIHRYDTAGQGTP